MQNHYLVSHNICICVLLQCLIGALISLAFVLQQTAEARSPSVKKFRDHIVSVLSDKHQTIMTKTGAILACGIIDAGGRNVVVNLQSRAGK